MTARPLLASRVSADWGQDTYWDAYARYAGEYNGIKLAARQRLVSDQRLRWQSDWRTTVRLRWYGLHQLATVNVTCCSTQLRLHSAVLRTGLTATSQAMWATGSPASTSSMWRPVCSSSVTMVGSSCPTCPRHLTVDGVTNLNALEQRARPLVRQGRSA